ncbi:acetoacetate decarboxylase family protein [Paremcibacter congregatus]|uniref:Acetoacetate decarboxylase n=1 Tax=Paremcibacter congregatus TaxID=2043170 RepID=A0A2G4YTC3_9PROT|nr:acetoacetate decarboxylase family protein [Paremcibacter congregatus]PHZ85500.1 hypothetical protein CRD36_06530 [Paremcibacter congregatus]QDE26246.1 hypothetical protein FIV45_02600 [Paremcibacter congregatus]
MTYEFHPDKYYRMPTHFGPSLGPRQGLDGRRYANIETSKDVIIQAKFEADKSQLEKLLPPGFALRDFSIVTLTFCYITEIEWLAGRGYNTFDVSIPATYHGKEETVHGDFTLVMWENKADPIITGREDLGIAKVYCEIPEPQFTGNDVVCRASWDGCEFASLKLLDLKEIPASDLPESGASEGSLSYKYIPKTGVPGEADVEYATLLPDVWPNVKLDQAMAAQTAAIQFRKSTWEELPTLVHIVNALSELKLGKCVEAHVMRSHGSKDLSDLRRIK